VGDALDLVQADGGVGTCCGLGIAAPREFAGALSNDSESKACCLSALLELVMNVAAGCCQWETIGGVEPRRKRSWI
jgi:hypothetical protein